MPRCNQREHIFTAYRSHSNVNLLVLTSTVWPTSFSCLSVVDPATREKQYAVALSAWASYLDGSWRIVLIDNSDGPIDLLHEVAKACSAVTLIQDGSLSARSEEGKGPGEARIVANASRLVDDFDEFDNVVKCTGRLFVPNAKASLRDVGGTLRCELRSSLTYADSRFFSAPPHFWTHHLTRLEGNINEREGIYFEHALSRTALGWIAEGGEWSSFVVLPRFRGVSGSTGASYQSTNRRRRLHDIRRKFLLRRDIVL